MPASPDISPRDLRKLLDYNPDTGDFIWLPRSRRWFKSDGNCKGWNTQFAGRPALTADNGAGYRCGMICNKKYKAHRVAYAIYHGAWPERHIDHINGDKADNRICNLRDVSRLENNQNAALRADNKSGVCGVYWDRKREKWVAHIQAKRKPLHIGSFENFLDAVAARKSAEVEHGFHTNHGRAV